MRGLASAGIGLGALRLPVHVTAKKKRRKQKKGKPNAFGCLDVGVSCQNAGQCCSSICQGKKGKKRCRDHDSGECAPGITPGDCSDSSEQQEVPCTTSRGILGHCHTTTGNAGYCSAPAEIGTFACSNCTRDVECQALLGAGAACVLCQDECSSPACVSPGP
jgi:hypothetical protein